MTDDNTILFKGDNAQLLRLIEQNEAAFQKLEEAVKSGAKSASEAAKDQRMLLVENNKLQRELIRQEQQEKKQQARQAKEAEAAEKRRIKEVREQRSAAAKEHSEMTRRASADLAKIQTPAQKYVEKLREWKVALQNNVITQEQFNRLKDSELQKLNQVSAALDRLDDKYENTADEAGEMGEASNTAMGGMIKYIGSAIASLLSLQKAVQFVREEYEHMLALQEKSRQASIDFQTAMEDLRMNFDPDETMDWEDLDQKVIELQRNTGVSDTTAAQALGGAFSTKGMRSNQWAADAALAALQLNRKPEEASALAESVGDIARLGESQDQKAILGFMAQAQKASIIKSVSQLGKQSVSALGAAQEVGLNVEQGMEYFATAGNLMNDKTGELSKTAMVTFWNQIGREFKLTSEQKKNKELLGQFKEFKSLPMDANQRIEFLRNNDKLKETFIENMHGGEAAGVALRSLINNDQKWRGEFENVTGIVPSVSAQNDAANQQSFAIMSKNVRGTNTPQGLIADSDAKSQANLLGQDLSRAAIEGSIGQMREIFSKTVKNDDLKGPDALANFASGTSLLINETFRHAEDALLDEMRGFRTYVKDADLPTYDAQLKEMERLHDSIKSARQGVSAQPVSNTSPQPANPPQEFEDTPSRYGQPIPGMNDRGVIEGTILEPGQSLRIPAPQQAGSNFGPEFMSAIQKLTGSIEGMRADFNRNAEGTSQQSQRNADRQFIATRDNKPPTPPKQSPLEKANRGSHGR